MERENYRNSLDLIKINSENNVQLINEKINVSPRALMKMFNFH